VDPDGYNKALSGRRATVVYALLIVNSDPDTAVGLWRQVAATENGGTDQQQMMQENVPEGTDSGDLHETYMKSLCPSDLALTPADFLSTGTDSKGNIRVAPAAEGRRGGRSKISSNNEPRRFR
jgi:hypothetical protein